MNRTYQISTWLMWLALPFTYLRFQQVWDRLPAHMATHFNAAGQPNGWMSREVALDFALGLTVFMLVIFTAVAYVAQWKHVPDTASWSLLGFFYVVMGFVYHVNSSVVEFNLTGAPVEVGPWLIAAPFVVLAFVAIFVGSKRGSELPHAMPLAEEHHASRAWAVVFAIPLAIEAVLFIAVPNPTMKFASVLLSVIFVGCFAFAWNGFQYRFTRAGVEIRTLGIRVRSIPTDQIREYAIEAWGIWRGGYGIRGVGRRRAYVWGNKVVHIQTPDSDVYLGHDQPERIVRDLDMIRGIAR